MQKLFGTDGVRGLANVQISGQMAFDLGKALAVYVTRKQLPQKVLVIKDTRLSGDMLCCAVCAGLNSMGVDAIYGGVLPTPSVHYLVQDQHAGAGVVITASHNPSNYNGLKMITNLGHKFDDQQEAELEQIYFDLDSYLPCEPNLIGRTIQNSELPKIWTDSLIDVASGSLDGVKIILDCACGASLCVAPYVLRALGATVTAIAADPGGSINDRCGSTHPDNIMEEMRKGDFDLGFSFDGDADRVAVFLRKGEMVDGDVLMFGCAKYIKKQGKLNKDTIVTTRITNFGLDESLEKEGIKVERVDVGGKSIQEKMLSDQLNFGAEDNGHISWGDYNMCSDGILTAVMISQMWAEGVLTEMLSGYQAYNQAKVNVEISERQRQLLDKLEPLIHELETELAQNGRIVVRPSGTESLVRVLVEGKDQEQIDRLAQTLKEAVTKL